MNKCPFCGAAKKDLSAYSHPYPLWECGTWQDRPDEPLSRSNECFRNQIAQQKELLRRAVEVIKGAANHRCNCRGDIPGTICSSSYKAQALLPELEKAVNEKPCQNG